MGKIKLLHSSDHIIENPDFLLGKTNNDYGRGFYCTQELSMAMEWACKKNSDGFADKTVYYPKFIARDSNARETYRKEIRNRHSYKNDIFVLDILREEMKDNDSRIQRILSI